MNEEGKIPLILISTSFLKKRDVYKEEEKKKQEQ